MEGVAVTTPPPAGDAGPARRAGPAPTNVAAGTQPDLACRFDPDAIRAWLTGANPSGKGTVGEVLRIGDDFDIYGFDKWVRISDLLAAAQTAGVFGLATAG